MWGDQRQSSGDQRELVGGVCAPHVVCVREAWRVYGVCVWYGCGVCIVYVCGTSQRVCNGCVGGVGVLNVCVM